MNKASVIVLACAALSLRYVHSADFYWVGASNDWWNAASYSASEGGSGGTQKPGPDDRVVISSDQQVFVDDFTIAFFSTVKEVHTSGRNITAHFNITTNADLNCYFGCFTVGAYEGTTLVKKGLGVLTFAKAGSEDLHRNPGKLDTYHYNINIDLQEGGLALEPKIESSTELRHRYGNVNVAERCTLYGVEGGLTWFAGLSGGGNVTNAVVEDSKLCINGARDEPTVFSGVMSGFEQFMPQGHTWYTGISNTIGTVIRAGGYDGVGDSGITGFMTFAGANGEASSLGCGSIDARSSARFLYLGTTGETIERSASIWDTGNAPLTWDAGAYGGLLFNGSFSACGSDGAQQRLVLTGSNTVTCVLSNKFARNHVSDPGSSFHITKSGTGTWRMCERTGSLLSGVIGVEEGVLEFDTLREKGSDSALGNATELFEDACENADNGLKTVPYAHFLGGSGTSGTLRYLGETSRTIRHRPIALKGDGRVEAPNCDVLNWIGVSGLGEGEKTLTVDCGEGQTNRYANITDGDGVVSVRKDGAGDLVLSGELSFSGDLVSSGGGCLTVRDFYGAQYEYYRLTLKETVYTSTDELFSDYVAKTGSSAANRETRGVMLNEFGLYSSAGTRINKWGDSADADCEATLGKGKIALQSADSITVISTTKNGSLVHYSPWRLLDSSNSSGYRFWVYWNDDVRMPVPDDPLSWISVVLRLKDDSGEAASFDINFLGYWGAAFGQTPTEFSVSASADGLLFEELYATNDYITATFPTNYYTWLSDGSTPVGTSASTNPERVSHKKIPLPCSTVQTQHSVLENIRSVSAAAGSVLRYEGAAPLVVSGLKVIGSSVGAIEGFAFGTEGTLYLEDADTDLTALDIPADLSGVTDLANLKGWALSVNGDMSSRYQISSVTADGIRVIKPGLRFIVR